MTADSEIDVKEAFQRSQKGHNNKAKLVASLKSRYDKVNSLRRAFLFLFFAVWAHQLHKFYFVTHCFLSKGNKFFEGVSLF